MSLCVDVLFNLDIGKSSLAGCNSDLLEFESRTNSIPPSQLLFHPNHYYHSFQPRQKSSPCLELATSHSRSLKCPLKGVGSGLCQARGKVPALRHHLKQISPYSPEVLQRRVQNAWFVPWVPWHLPHLPQVEISLCFSHEPRGTAESSFHSRLSLTCKTLVRINEPVSQGFRLLRFNFSCIL